LLSKFFIGWFAFHGAVNAWRIGSWIGLAIAIALIATYLVLRERRRQQS
jgi:hypothetical protein